MVTDRKEQDVVAIRHRVGIAAPQARVFEALTTTEGLSRWWKPTVDGDPKVGGTLRIYFGGPEPGVSMEVADLRSPDHVGWHCVQGPEEWVGTNLSFDLKRSDDETVLLFTHTWREPVEFMHHCSTKWAQYLLGLKSWLEGGEAIPYPEPPKISSWS